MAAVVVATLAVAGLAGMIWLGFRRSLDLPVSLLDALDASYLDRRCGDLRAGVVDREPETVIWMECECSARTVRAIDAAEEPTG